MTQRLVWPDAEQVFIDLVDDLGYACGDLPKAEAFSASLPIIWIARTGGSSDGITDRPILDVDCIAMTRRAASEVAQAVRGRVFSSPGTAPGGFLIDSASELTGRSPRPDVDPKLSVIQATFQLSFRPIFNAH